MTHTALRLLVVLGLLTLGLVAMFHDALGLEEQLESRFLEPAEALTPDPPPPRAHAGLL